MSASLYLYHLNSYLTDAKKRVYLDELASAPFPDTPLLSLIPHNQSYITDVTRWKFAPATLDGISLGTIGEVGDLEAIEASISMKRMFQRIKIDRFSMKITQDPRASVINFLEDGLRKAAKERSLVLESMIVRGDQTGAIGTISSVVDNGGGSYDLVITDATWAIGNFRRRLMLNVDVSADLFRITGIDEDNRKITVLRDSGTTVPLAAQVLYRQRGLNQYPTGLKEIIEGSGSLFGITRQHGWRSTVKDLGGAPVNMQSLLEMMVKIHQRSNEWPDTLIVSNTQYIRLQDLVKDNTIITRDASSVRTNAEGVRSYEIIPNVKFLDIAGQQVKLLVHSHMPQGSLYFANTRHMEIASVGPGEFVPPVNGGSDMMYMGAITGSDSYDMVWAYDFALRCESPIYFGGLINAALTLQDQKF